MQQRLQSYFATLAALPDQTRSTDRNGVDLPLATVLELAVAAVTSLPKRGRILFVGNGGSAGIASHCAIDYLKNGGYPALAFNDGAALTCIGNDLGFENIFAHQVKMHGQSDDVLMAISSSGRSPNILRAVAAARTQGCRIFTFSGFGADNPLRAMGDLNFYVPSSVYGFVEIFHLTLIHAVLDMAMGWTGAGSDG